MATIQLVDNKTIAAIDVPEILYTAPENESVVIDSFTAANVSGVNASYKAYVVSADGDDVPQIPFKIIVWGDNDLGIGIVNQVIPAEGHLKVECSALDSIYFTVSGRTVSS